MKNSALLIAIQLALFANIGMAQISSDDPSFNQKTPVKNPTTATAINKSITNGPVTIDGEILDCDSTQTTLTVSGACFYEWYADSNQTTLLGSNSDLVVNSITNDTTVYYVGSQVNSPTSFALPAQTSVFSGNVRGYFFQAPTDLNVSKIYVPTDASTGNPSVAILRFNSGPPATWSATTNDFTVLGLWQDTIADTIYTCIPISAGDYIGVLGQRGGVNSYAPGAYSTTINGSTVTLDRLGMQYSLATTAPQDVFQEPGGNISRVELFYGDLTSSGQPIPVNITVPQPYSSTSSLDICQGDSVLINGNYYMANETAVDSLQTTSGCDSLLITNIVGLPLESSSNVIDFCSGDSVLVNSTYYSAAGTVVDTLQTVAGCDSIVTSILSVIALPDTTVTQSGFGLTLTSNQTGASYQWYDCDSGLPISGETSATFTATANGNYSVEVTLNGCPEMSGCTNVSTVGADELALEIGLSVFPNPTKSELNYTFKGDESLTYEFYDLNGKLILKGEMTNNTGKIDVSNIASGTYVIEVHNNEFVQMIKVIIE